MHQLSTVAHSFPEHVRFGKVDLISPENSGILEEYLIVATPTLVYYQFGVPSGEDIGEVNILRWLDHSSIVHYYGHTRTWLKLIR